MGLLLNSASYRFIVAHWSDAENEDTLCILVPKLVSSGALTSSHGGKDTFHIPQVWQDQIVSKFERLEGSPFPEQALQQLPIKILKSGTIAAYQNMGRFWKS